MASQPCGGTKPNKPTHCVYKQLVHSYLLELYFLKGGGQVTQKFWLKNLSWFCIKTGNINYVKMKNRKDAYTMLFLSRWKTFKIGGHRSFLKHIILLRLKPSDYSNSIIYVNKRVGLLCCIDRIIVPDAIRYPIAINLLVSDLLTWHMRCVRLFLHHNRFCIYIVLVPYSLLVILTSIWQRLVPCIREGMFTQSGAPSTTSHSHIKRLSISLFGKSTWLLHVVFFTSSGT